MRLADSTNKLTEECIGDEFGHLVARLARLRKMAEFFVKHSLELQSQTTPSTALILCKQYKPKVM